MRRQKFHDHPILRAGDPGSGMLFGHNTNVTVGGVVIHVQTEDRGMPSAIIDTTVYHRGRVLHRRTSKYSDLLPLNPENEKTLKIRLDQQHAAVVTELRSGALQVPIAPPNPPLTATTPLTPVSPAVQKPTSPLSPLPKGGEKSLTVDLLNPRTWLTGKQATLYLVVRSKESASVVAAARVSARIEGGVDKTEVTTATGADGHAQLQFDMPRLVSEDAALVIEASAGEARGHLRFQLRAKPKVPAAG
jgi:hypothetical protein